MNEPSRYRTENGEAHIDVHAASVERLFDNRDPAPFRERDLDPDLVEYLFAAGEDLVGRDKLRLVFWLDNPCPPQEISTAVRAHFEYELDRIDRRRQRQRRTGQITLLLAFVLLVALLSVAQVVEHIIGNSLGAAVKEGLVISSWVLMWRPVEVLVYDWIPWRRQRRVIKRLIDAPVELRTGQPS